MYRFIIFSLIAVCLLSTLLLIYVNLKMASHPHKMTSGNDTIDVDLLYELRGLKEASGQNAGEKMQQLYPEGYLFFYTLYGISCSEFARNLDKNSALYNEIHTEAQRCFDLVNTDNARAIFDKDLSIPYGAFYNGWSMYLLGKKLLSEAPQKRDSAEVALITITCREIADVLRIETYPPSYNRSSWPADAVLCLAALSLHDRLFAPRYRDDIADWLRRVRANPDALGLIPHAVQYGTTMAMEESRGSSLGLMLCFMKDIDAEFADEQFERYKKHFLTYRMGLPAIREYPKEREGFGDVDSGPVIFGMGASATITAQRTMNVFGEYTLVESLRRSVEAFGFPNTVNEKKRYLFGQLPVADAFIAWGHSAVPVTRHSEYPSGVIKFHLYSLLIGICFALMGVWLWKKRSRSLHG